jgi:hypothetical protein
MKNKKLERENKYPKAKYKSRTLNFELFNLELKTLN